MMFLQSGFGDSLKKQRASLDLKPGKNLHFPRVASRADRQCARRCKRKHMRVTHSDEVFQLDRYEQGEFQQRPVGPAVHLRKETQLI